MRWYRNIKDKVLNLLHRIRRKPRLAENPPVTEVTPEAAEPVNWLTGSGSGGALRNPPPSNDNEFIAKPFLEQNEIIEEDIIDWTEVLDFAEPTFESIAPPKNIFMRQGKHPNRDHFERERLKFDKWVEPKGPKPVSREKGPAKKPVAKPVSAEIVHEEDEDGYIIVDVHHSDRTTKVLYEENEIFGAFNFRDTIIDQLPRYYFYLDRMKKHDNESYQFYRQVGGMLLPYMAVPDIWRDQDGDKDYLKPPPPLNSYFNARRPAFGCIAYGASPEAEKIERELDEKEKVPKKWLGIMIPRFVYFCKYKPKGMPPELQPITREGDIYKMTVWFDKDTDRGTRKNKYGEPNDFGVFVSKAGEVVVLKTISTKWVTIHGKNWYKNGSFKIPKREWSIPNQYEEWAKHHGVNAQLFLSKLFIDMVDKCEDAAFSMARISVEKDKQYAMFGVDIHRLPYFFKDRDYQLTGSGTRKPILHLVRAHEHGGKIVRFHFRGARQFTWADYNVSITIPGKDHPFWEGFAEGSLDDRVANKMEKKKLVDMPEFGEIIRDSMNK